MMVDVHLTDGRTVIRATSRGPVIDLIRRDPDALDESRAIKVWIDRGQGDGFVAGQVLYVKKHSIAWIERIHPDEGDPFLAERAPHVLEQIQARRAERERAEAA